jgi:hypothetical protein
MMALLNQAISRAQNTVLVQAAAPFRFRSYKLQIQDGSRTPAVPIAADLDADVPRIPDVVMAHEGVQVSVPTA